MSWSDYPREFLYCRAWGHHWETRGAFLESDAGVRVIRQRWDCSCGSKAVDLFTRAFVRHGYRQYTYPNGYTPAPDRAEARQEWFRRHPPEGETTRRVIVRAGSR